MTIYEKIKALCDSKGISIRECEKRAGIGNGTIAGWHTSSPVIAKLQAVANVLDVSISKLVED